MAKKDRVQSPPEDGFIPCQWRRFVSLEITEEEYMLNDACLRNPNLCRLNYRNKMNGLELLGNINSEAVSAAFFDPQYRGVLDKLQYGNEGKGRGQARCDLTQMSEDIIKAFIRELDRVLKPSGHLFLWVDKFHLCTGVAPWLFGTGLSIVDLITWDKGRIGMGYRTRRRAEYLVVIQKTPVRVKGCWTVHTLPDVVQEKVTKTHAHSKPVWLQSQLILAVTQPGELVCDPASGGYSVFEACKATGRDFLGGDIQYGDDPAPAGGETE